MNSRNEHFGPEPIPDRSHLQPDVAAADDQQFFGDLRQRQRLGRADDVFPVERQARQFDRRAAGGDENAPRA